MNPFEDLMLRIKALRDPQNGCPWDLEQTHASLSPYFLEEVHEYLEALERHGPDSPKTWEELGDVLFQVALHAQLFQEKGFSDLGQIAAQLARKIVERHPHVFDPQAPRFKTSDEVNRAWERLKAEREAKRVAAGGAAPKVTHPLTTRLEEIPRSLPSLQAAARMGEKAASFGFDWPAAEDVRPKIREELGEWLEATGEGPAREQEELGDLLFAVAQYCRLKKWDPEALVRASSAKFTRRIRGLEDLLQERGLEWRSLDLNGLEALYQESKAKQKDR